jgi:hypothetical protein
VIAYSLCGPGAKGVLTGFFTCARPAAPERLDVSMLRPAAHAATDLRLGPATSGHMAAEEELGPGRPGTIVTRSF